LKKINELNKGCNKTFINIDVSCKAADHVIWDHIHDHVIWALSCKAMQVDHQLFISVSGSGSGVHPEWLTRAQML
jgi:hypothetical protein